MSKNNFDFLRLSFALLVVLGHSYGLSGNGESMELISIISNKQLSLTSIGLNGFFVISGYLIFKSLIRSQSLKGYYWRRFLRLYPALFVVLLLTTFFSFFLYDSEIPFLKNKDVYTYLPNNLSLYNLQFTIQGVLTKNTHHTAINGSLWTICYELTLYVLLSFLFLFRENVKLIKCIVFSVFVVFFMGYVFYYERLSDIYFIGLEGKHFLNLGGFFISGSFLSCLEIEKMKHKKPVLLLVSSIFIVSIYYEIYNVVKHIVFPLLILLLALIPIKKIYDFGKVGDMSYGIYIYSFPIQQILMYFFNFNGKQLMFTSVILSIIFGFFSWHLIENKAMSYKQLIF